MGRTEQEPTTSPLQPSSERSDDVYQPPQVAWEEEFAPVADSICVNPWDPGCV